LSSGLISDYEIARRLRMMLKIKSCNDLVHFALSCKACTDAIESINCPESSNFCALLIEQIDLNRYLTPY